MQHFLTPDRAWGLLILSAGLLIWFASATFPEVDSGYPDPALFPRVIALGLLFTGLLLLLRKPVGKDAPLTFSFSGSGWGRSLLLLASVAIFPFFASALGFVPAIGMLVLGVGMLFRLRLLTALLSAAITSGLIYLVFVRLLNVPL